MEKTLDFAKTLTRLLKKKRMTQTELSKYINLGSQNVSMYCNGKTQPDFENLLKIAEILNVTTDELLTGIAPEDVKLNEDLGLSGGAIENIKHADYSKKLLNSLLSNSDFYLQLNNIIDRLKEIEEFKEGDYTVNKMNSLGRGVSNQVLYKYEISEIINSFSKFLFDFLITEPELI